MWCWRRWKNRYWKWHGGNKRNVFGVLLQEECFQATFLPRMQGVVVEWIFSNICLENWFDVLWIVGCCKVIDQTWQHLYGMCMPIAVFSRLWRFKRLNAIQGRDPYHSLWFIRTMRLEVIWTSKTLLINKELPKSFEWAKLRLTKKSECYGLRVNYYLMCRLTL